MSLMTSSPTSPKGQESLISTSGTRTARVRSGTKVVEVQSETQSLSINSTPTFVVQGPGGKKVVGSGVLPLSQIESAIKSVE